MANSQVNTLGASRSSPETADNPRGLTIALGIGQTYFGTEVGKVMLRINLPTSVQEP